MVYVVIHEVEYLDKYLMIKHTMLNIFTSIKNDAFFFRNLDVIINLTWKKPNSKCVPTLLIAHSVIAMNLN